ncbi:ribonucleotide reductase of class II (coenzyme B12-dependent) (EC 1.17.4.1) [Nanoarchaeota archaeon]
MTNNNFINKDIKDTSSFLVQRSYKIKKVIKRDGRIVDFDPYRIYYAIERAMRATGKYNKELLEKITEYIIKVLEEKYDDIKTPSVEEIQDIVELALLKFDLYEVAKAYISYRKEKEKIRQEKINLLGKFYEEEVAKKFSINSIRLMVNRYLLRDENKNIIEGPKQMFERVAALIVIPDILYDERIYDKEGKQSVKEYEEFVPEQWEGKLGLVKEGNSYKLKWNKYHLERMKYLYDYLNKRGHMKVKWSEFLEMLQKGEFDKYYENYLKYFDLMASKKFMPNSPTLFNAGARLGQLSACFVIDIDDDMESIMKAARDAALIFKSGGGIGINYSKLRPEGDVVASTGGVASGPVSFMKIIDTITDVVKQGGCVAIDSTLFTDKGIIKPYEIKVPNPKDDAPLPISIYDGKDYVDAYIGSFGDKQELLKFVTEGGYELEVTYDELVATVDEKGEITFKPAQYIKEGDYLILTLGNHIGQKIKLPPIEKSHYNSNDVKVPEYLDEDLAEILGYYISKGAWSNGRFILSFNNEKIFKYFEEKIKKAFNLSPGEIRDNKTWLDVVWFSKDLERYFEERGWKKNSSPEAFIPSDILKSEEKVLASFLRGLFEGDGDVHVDGYPRLYSTSETLIKQVQLALLSLGIFSKRIKVSKEKLGREHYGDKDIYVLYIIDKESIERFKEKIGFISEEKNQKIKFNKKYERIRIIPNPQYKLQLIFDAIKMEDKEKASKFYRKVHKYMLGYRNLSYYSLTRLKKQFPELEKQFDGIYERYIFVKVKKIEKTKKEVFHFETSSGKYTVNGFLIHNKRRGANMGVLESWHADILKFVHAKEKEGVLENFNISVMVEPEFWKYYEENKPYPLLNPRILRKYNYPFPGDPNYNPDNLPKDAIVSYIDPKQLLSEIAYVAWEKADPGCLFMDNINRRNMQYKFRGPIRATNPCVVGDTRVLTPFGYIKIEDLYNLAKIHSKDILYSLDISKGGEKFAYLTNILIPVEENIVYVNTKGKSISYSTLEEKPGYVWKVGYKKVYKVIFDEGLEIEATDDHRFITKDGWKKISDLKAGDKVKLARIDIDNIENYGLKEYKGIKLDYNLGFSIGKNIKENIPEIVYYANSEFVKGFIYGIFVSKGIVENDKIKIIDNIKLLKEIQKLLLLFGILSKIYIENNKHTLIVDNYDLFIKKIVNRVKDNVPGDLYLTVKSVEYVGEKVVYDMTVPEEHIYITNGLISHNCGEQPLYPYESCNLGSINLYAMIDFKDGKPEFNWERYIETIKWAYRFLDNVLDVNKYPIPEIEEGSKAVRRVGLGYMGLADAMFALGIPYSSEEGFKFVMRVTEYLTYYSMLESIERAKTRGVFPKYNETSYKDGELPIEGYYHKELWTLDWDKVVELIKKYGIRNVEVTSIAPTGSISMLVDVSSGIEPQYALVYEKRVTAGVYYYVDVELERQLKERGLYNEEILKKISDNGGSLLGIDEIPDDLKRIFLTALDIPWWDHVRAQAVAQIWITTSISKTINMPSWVTPEDVHGAYVFAYKTGCKGITIYREGSKSAQVYYAPAEVGKNRIRDYLRLIKEGKIENKTLELLKEFGIKVPMWYYELIQDNKKENNIKVNINIPEPKITPENVNNDIKVEKCPVCGSTRLKHQSGCITCLDCGWSECILA